MPILYNIRLCFDCTTSFDAGLLDGQPVFDGCPRCQSSRVYWSIPAARHLAGGGSLAAAFALAELDQQRLATFFYRRHPGDAQALGAFLKLNSGNFQLTGRPTLLHHLRLTTSHFLQCAN